MSRRRILNLEPPQPQGWVVLFFPPPAYAGIHPTFLLLGWASRITVVKAGARARGGAGDPVRGGPGARSGREKGYPKQGTAPALEVQLTLKAWVGILGLGFGGFGVWGLGFRVCGLLFGL